MNRPRTRRSVMMEKESAVENFSPIARRKSSFQIEAKTPKTPVTSSSLAKFSTSGAAALSPFRTPNPITSFRTPIHVVPSPLTKSSITISDTPKTDPVMMRIQKDLNSPSAAARVRAKKALISPKFRKAAYEQFDIAHEIEEFVMTEEQRKPAPPKSVQEVFQSCRIFVEVRTGDDNRSAGIKNRLIRDGITVNEKLYKDTTHVIFKDGLLSTYKNAKKLGIPVVTILWVDACIAQRRLVDTEKFKISNIERYERPELFKRIRRQKSMQPEVTKSVSTPVFERSLSQNSPGSVEKTIVEEEESMEITLHKDKVIDKLESDLDKWRESIRRFTTYTPNPMEQTAAVERRKTVFFSQTSSASTNSSNKTIIFNSSNKIAVSSRRSVFDISMNLLELNCKAMSQKKDDENWDVEETPKIVHSTTQVVKKAEVRKRKLFNDCFDDETKENSQASDKSLKTPEPKRKSLKISNIPHTEGKKKNKDSTLKRRETVAFFKAKEVSVVKQKSPVREPMKFIVLTNMSGADKQILHAAIVELGGKVETQVTSSTTHVVSPNEDRTMNILRGVIRACTIVNANWIHESLSQKKWLDTSLYRHNICDSNRVRERSILGSKIYSNNTFSLYGPFFLNKNGIESPKKIEYLGEVITLCGGILTESILESKIVVSDKPVKTEKTVVTSALIFDSAMKGSLMEPMLYAPRVK